MTQQVAVLGAHHSDAALGASDVVGLGTWLRTADTQHHMRLSASAVNKVNTLHANASRREMPDPKQGVPPLQFNARASEIISAIVDHTSTAKAAYTEGSSTTEKC